MVRHYWTGFPPEIDPAATKHLVETLKQNLAPYHRYLNVRKRILGLQEYHAYDRFLRSRPSCRRLPLWPSLSLPHGFSQSHAAEAIPDYSKVDRNKVPVAFRWRIEDIYPSEEAWKTDLAQALEDLEAFDLAILWLELPRRNVWQSFWMGRRPSRP